MPAKKQHPSAASLLAIAEAAEAFAGILPHAVFLWDAEPEESPAQILVKRHVDDKAWYEEKEGLKKGEYDEWLFDGPHCEDIGLRARQMMTSWQQLHQLLTEVWHKYLDFIGPPSPSGFRQEREPLPETEVEGWRVEVVLALRGLQKDLASFQERLFALGEASLRESVTMKTAFSKSLVESIQMNSRILREVVRSNSQWDLTSAGLPSSISSDDVTNKEDSQPPTIWEFPPGYVVYNDVPIKLGGIERDLLRTLVDARYAVDILGLKEAGWRDDFTQVADTTVRSHLSTLRKKLRDGLRLPMKDPIPNVERGDGRTVWELHPDLRSKR